jgi:hypothetical protein
MRRLDRIHRALPLIVGVLTLAVVVLLIAWDVFPGLFPAKAHDWLAALPLAMIALAYLVYQAARRPPLTEWLKAILLALAFLCWSANQFWPSLAQATLLNDAAIALFVLDVFLVIIGWPPASPDESFAETYVAPDTPATR